MEQNCEKCGTSWNADEPIQCPTCQAQEGSPTMADPRIVELSGTLKLVNPKDYHFAPENYVVPKSWWQRFKEWVLSCYPFRPFIM